MRLAARESCMLDGLVEIYLGGGGEGCCYWEISGPQLKKKK